MVAASFGAAEVSWRLIEQPIARLKARGAENRQVGRLIPSYSRVPAQEGAVGSNTST